MRDNSCPQCRQEIHTANEVTPAAAMSKEEEQEALRRNVIARMREIFPLVLPDGRSNHRLLHADVPEEVRALFSKLLPQADWPLLMRLDEILFYALEPFFCTVEKEKEYVQDSHYLLLVLKRTYVRRVGNCVILLEYNIEDKGYPAADAVISHEKMSIAEYNKGRLSTCKISYQESLKSKPRMVPITKWYVDLSKGCHSFKTATAKEASADNFHIGFKLQYDGTKAEWVDPGCFIHQHMRECQQAHTPPNWDAIYDYIDTACRANEAAEPRRPGSHGMSKIGRVEWGWYMLCGRSKTDFVYLARQKHWVFTNPNDKLEVMNWHIGK